jgi:hypothetical protein
MDQPRQEAVLKCGVCGIEGLHELHYAGRLLASAKCKACGTVMRHTPNELRKEYIKDLQSRVVTKPFRLMHRLLLEPSYLWQGLPNALKRQPKKFIDEAKELKNDPTKD